MKREIDYGTIIVEVRTLFGFYIGCKVYDKPKKKKNCDKFINHFGDTKGRK